MTTHIAAGDALPAYCGLPRGLAAEALQHMSSYRLNVLAYILGVAQMRAAAPNRARQGQPQDERLVIDVGWLVRASGRAEDTAVSHVLGLGETRLGGGPLPWDPEHIAPGEPLLTDVVDKGERVLCTVPQHLAYPRAFGKVGVPLLTGNKVQAAAYLELATYCHHGGKKPLQLSVALDDEDLAALNQHLKWLDRTRLDGHVTLPRRIARNGFRLILRDGSPAPTTIALIF